LSLLFLIEGIRVISLINLCKAGPRPELPIDIRDAFKKGNIEGVCDLVGDRLTVMRYLVGALPLVGFLGSVAGLSNSLIGASGISSEIAIERQSSLQEMQIALGTAFDKSMLAFVATIVCLAGLYYVGARLAGLRALLSNQNGTSNSK
jgi:hypothetical protein